MKVNKNGTVSEASSTLSNKPLEIFNLWPFVKGIPGKKAYEKVVHTPFAVARE